MKNFLVTGGGGFIGSTFIKEVLKNKKNKVCNLDKITYASNLSILSSFKKNRNYIFFKNNLQNYKNIHTILKNFKPNFIIHFAAESHVDRSIANPIDFAQSNILGTMNLLEASRLYWNKLSSNKKKTFRFLNISTDEVFGSLGKKGLFNENSNYDPSSPYSASKASSDHLVRAWNKTFKIPTIITNCSNNYGPFQYPEKLIPLTIINALNFKKLPIYGNGKQIRDWLHVNDHVSAILRIINDGNVGHTYNIGANNEKSNIEIVKQICFILDELQPILNKKIKSYSELINFVKDRPGHDLRYAIDAKKIKKEIKWKPDIEFKKGIKETVKWYIENKNDIFKMYKINNK